MREDRVWIIGGADAVRLAAPVKAAGEFFLEESGGDPLVALLLPCETLNLMRPGYSWGMAWGKAGASLVAEALDVICKADRPDQ